MNPLNRFTAFILAAVLSAIATAALLSAFVPDTDPDDPRPPVRTLTSGPPIASPSDTDEPARFATVERVNQEGGYSFAYPPTWQRELDGTVSTVTSPQQDVVISFGIGPAGNLEGAAQELESLVGATYEVIRVGFPRSAEIGGREAVTFRGAARNTDGTRLAFEVWAIAGSRPENYAITVFAHPDAATALAEVIGEIVNSFSPAATS